MVRSRLAGTPVGEWILPGLVGLALVPIVWIASSQLLDSVPGPAVALTSQIGDVGVVLLTGVLAMALVTGLIVGSGEVDRRVRRNA